MTVITNEHNIQIKALRTAGISLYKIARQLDINYSTLKSHVANQNLLATLPTKIKRYKGKIQGRDQLQIKKYLQYDPFATLAAIKEACGLDFSIMTIHRYLKYAKLDRTLAKRKILLSEANRVKRLNFCKRMILKDDDYFSRIMWTDETKVQAYPNGECVFYRAFPVELGGKEFVTPMKQNGGGGVMFWGCMTRRAWGPIRAIEGTINGETYLQLLKDKVIPEIEASPVPLIFQQDNAPAHKKATVTTFLQAQNFETLDWPPQSPDLSPIEWVWNIIKMKMKALKPRPRTPATMRAAILDIWDNLEDSTREKTVDTFRKRLQQCIDRKGGFTDF
jgi:transposase